MTDTARSGAAAYTDGEIEFGRWLFAQDCQFIFGATDVHSLPAGERIEVAFAGRSNVGKSSLLNALTNRKSLARISHTPGRTQQLNLFDLAGQMVLVDLPGYGYAKASKADIARWTAVVRDYLLGRAELRRLFLLIDSRRGIMPVDLEVMDELDRAAVVYQLVLTKSDKVKPQAMQRLSTETAAALAAHPAAMPTLCVTSAHNGEGIKELKAEIGRLVRQ